MDDVPDPDERPVPSGRPGRRRRVLVAILALEGVALLCVMATSPELRSTLDRMLPGAERRAMLRDYAPQMAADPRPGLRLPPGGPQAALGRPDAGRARGWLLVWVGGCASCMKTDLRVWERQASEQGLRMALLTSADGAAAERFRKELRLASPAVRDPQGALSRSLNTVWFPRPYLFTPDWRLVWLSRDPSLRGRPLLDDPSLLACLRSPARQ